jgi:hypothetical protein
LPINAGLEIIRHCTDGDNQLFIEHFSKISG